eukprot:gene35035-47074_t
MDRRQGVLDVKIVQLVKLLRNGEPVKMSKRSGDFVTLREVVDEVGSDAVRFMMLFRKNDAVLDFDLAKVIEQSKDNPVFYVQYGHARGHSIFRNAREMLADLPLETAERIAYLKDAAVERLDDPAELGLMRQLALYPRMIESAAVAHEPHRIAFYLYELASDFHALWTRGRDMPHLRFIITNDAQLTKARLALVQSVVSVLASGLAVLGVTAPDEMPAFPLEKAGGQLSRRGCDITMANQYQNRPSPADDAYARDAHRRAKGDGDPLAELARLIGQTDPFVTASREPLAPRRSEPAYQDEPDYETESAPPGPPPWMQRAAAHEARHQDYESIHPVQRYGAEPAQPEHGYDPAPAFAAHADHHPQSYDDQGQQQLDRAQPPRLQPRFIPWVFLLLVPAIPTTASAAPPSSNSPPAAPPASPRSQLGRAPRRASGSLSGVA